MTGRDYAIRDTVLYRKGSRIVETNRVYNALRFPLMCTKDEDGWKYSKLECTAQKCIKATKPNDFQIWPTIHHY